MMRTRGARRAARWVLACGLAAALPGCSVDKQEMQRARSPDNQVDAVLVRINGGATTAFAWNLYLVPAGAKAEGHSTFNADVRTSDPVTLAWKAPGLLEVAYPEARINEFTNAWSAQVSSDSTYHVELMLRRLASTPAPAPEPVPPDSTRQEAAQQ